MKRILVLSMAFAWWGGAPGAFAASGSLSLDAAQWVPYTGAGTLSNVTDDVPGQGSVTVLSANSSQGTGFGYVERNYTSLSHNGRYVTVSLKSAGAFIFYVRVRAANGQDYYLQYTSAQSRTRKLDAMYLNYTLSADYPRRMGTYYEFVIDLQRDLAALEPAAVYAYARWVAVRGPASIGRIRFDDAVSYVNSDTDGDGLLGSEEDARGTSPFRADSDGDGLLDGVESGSPCGDPLDANVPAAGDGDGDGTDHRSEVYLRSKCTVADEGFLPTAYGWGVYADAPNPGIAQGAGGALELSHSAASPLALGVLNPDSSGVFRHSSPLRLDRQLVSFEVKSGEPFYVYVRVLGSNGAQYYLAYGSHEGAPSQSPGYAVYPLGSLGYTFGASEYVLVRRDMNADLAALFPGVGVSEVLWVAVRGRLSLKNIRFPEVRNLRSGYGISPFGFPASYDQIFAFFTETAAELAHPAVMWNGAWRDDAVTGTDAGIVPFAADFVAAQGPGYGYEPIAVFGWRSGATLFVQYPGNTVNNWSNAGAAALYAQAVTLYLSAHPVDYLFLGNENDGYFELDPVDYARWVTVYNATYDAAKAVSPGTLIGPVFQYENLSGQGRLNGWNTAHWGALDAHDLARVDVVGVTVYPFLHYSTAATVPASHLDPLRERIGSIPIAITETGWPAETLGQLTPLWIPSQQEQSDYLSALTAIVRRHDVRLVNWLFLHAMVDTTQPPQRNIGWEIFGSVSVRDSAGAERAVYTPWREFSAAATAP